MCASENDVRRDQTARPIILRFIEFSTDNPDTAVRIFFRIFYLFPLILFALQLLMSRISLFLFQFFMLVEKFLNRDCILSISLCLENFFLDLLSWLLSNVHIVFEYLSSSDLQLVPNQRPSLCFFRWFNASSSHFMPK